MGFVLDKQGNYLPVFGESAGGSGGTVNLWTAAMHEYYSNATLENDIDNNTYKDYTTDLSSLLPNDGAQYEVLFLLACTDGNIIVNSDIADALGGYTGHNIVQRDQLLVPVGAGRSITLRVHRTATGLYMNSSMYRKIG